MADPFYLGLEKEPADLAGANKTEENLSLGSKRKRAEPKQLAEKKKESRGNWFRSWGEQTRSGTKNNREALSDPQRKKRRNSEAITGMNEQRLEVSLEIDEPVVPITRPAGWFSKKNVEVLGSMDVRTKIIVDGEVNTEFALIPLIVYCRRKSLGQM